MSSCLSDRIALKMRIADCDRLTAIAAGPKLEGARHFMAKSKQADYRVRDFRDLLRALVSAAGEMPAGEAFGDALAITMR